MTITIDAVQGIGKRVYDKAGIQKLLPLSAIIQRRVGWEKGTRKGGESYQIPVRLRAPNGFTYAGSTGAAATSLKAARPMVIKQATITPFELDLREKVLWVALSRAAEEGEAAFASLTGEMFKAMKESAANRKEAAMLLGQRPIGEIEAVTDLGSQKADLTITEASWRPGLFWALSEGATFDSFTATVKNNGSGPLILDGITTATRKIRVTYTGTLGSEITAGDNLYFEGAWDGTTFYEMPGLITQSRNTTGSSLGLSADTYMTWKGNTYDVAGKMSTDAAEESFAQLRDRGAAGKLSMYISNKGQSVLLSELKTQRILDSSYQPVKQKTGTKAIELETPDIGEVEIINHPYMALGEFLTISDNDCGQVGSSDLTFGVPGFESENLFLITPDYNQCELILFCDLCVVNKRPNFSQHGTGITYSG